MRTRSLNLALAVAVSLLSLAACDKAGKAPSNTVAQSGTMPAATAPATPSNTVMASAAPDASGRAAVKTACADDIQKFCAGEAKWGRCLKQHEGELSQACIAARAARKAEREAAKGQ